MTPEDRMELRWNTTRDTIRELRKQGALRTTEPSNPPCDDPPAGSSPAVIQCFNDACSTYKILFAACGGDANCETLATKLYEREKMDCLA
jgi:hypothetical protein